MNKDSLKNQHKSVKDLYNSVADKYEEELEGKAEYQAPFLLREIYKKYNIVDGVVLDIGCGTGKIMEYLGDKFSYSGIDISENMVKLAEKRGIKGYVGPVEDVIKTMEDKSVDHIIALSSLYFIEDFSGLIKEFERVARKSFLLTLEQFNPEVTTLMEGRGIQIFNHSLGLIQNPADVVRDTYLWKRPHTEDQIYGDVVFKLLN